MEPPQEALEHKGELLYPSPLLLLLPSPRSYLLQLILYLVVSVALLNTSKLTVSLSREWSAPFVATFSMRTLRSSGERAFRMGPSANLANVLTLSSAPKSHWAALKATRAIESGRGSDASMGETLEVIKERPLDEDDEVVSVKLR